MLSKQDVVNAAARLADRDGYETLSLASVAKELGIKTPSLYNHVEGLPGLRRDLAVLGFEEMTAVLSTAAIGRERDEAVREVARAYRQFALSRRGLYAATLHPLSPGESPAAGRLLETVVSVLRGYKLDHDGTLHAVRGLRSALHGFISLESIGQFAMPLNIDVSFDLLIETIIAGLRAGSA